eukprot:TRINITY_DN440_c0_g1_i1.p1 TRINITY_DN440_c0_g1~~TRINITY_DN440_c0_g1_i1.p1  ORF type:complete len:259 (+),score=63.86 TRINITY_DN440_c0_g1_i1:64-777(+)
MRASLLFLLFIATVHGDCFSGAAVAARTLVQCPQYSSAGCCTNDIDSALGDTFTLISSTYSGSCLANLKNVLCAGACHPNQTALGTFSPNPLGVSTINERITPAYADGIFAICKQTCIRSNGTRYQDIFGNSVDYFTSLAFPFSLSGLQAQALFTINETGFETAVVGPFANDTYPCPPNVTAGPTSTIPSAPRPTSTSATASRPSGTTTIGTISQDSLGNLAQPLFFLVIMIIASLF